MAKYPMQTWNIWENLMGTGSIKPETAACGLVRIAVNYNLMMELVPVILVVGG
ncbi:hypothetical protein MalM14_41160 [Gimesia chilikensis]|nr:hypothetical protein MalM14_41160 [Gimesia chilikensis]